MKTGKPEVANTKQLEKVKKERFIKLGRGVAAHRSHLETGGRIYIGEKGYVSADYIKSK